jgi:hypothetical protein
VPFTGSHPAAVLPLIGIGLAPSALVIGSLSPDIPYFAPGPFDASATHSLTGIVTVDVLLSLGVYLVWHTLLVPAAVAIAPPSLRSRLPAGAATGLRPRIASARLVLLVVLACAVGALTHVAWDSFTHQGRWGVRHVTWLHEQLGVAPGYVWAQDVSGLVGVAILVAWLVRWWRSTPPVSALPHASAGPRLPVSTAVAVTVVAVAAVCGALSGALPAITEDRGPDVNVAVFGAISRGGAAATLSVVAVAVAVLVRERRHGSR